MGLGLALAFAFYWNYGFDDSNRLLLLKELVSLIYYLVARLQT